MSERRWFWLTADEDATEGYVVARWWNETPAARGNQGIGHVNVIDIADPPDHRFWMWLSAPLPTYREAAEMLLDFMGSPKPWNILPE